MIYLLPNLYLAPNNKHYNVLIYFFSYLCFFFKGDNKSPLI